MSMFWFDGGVKLVEHVEELVPFAEILVPETYPFMFEVPLQEVLAEPGHEKVTVLCVVVHSKPSTVRRNVLSCARRKVEQSRGTRSKIVCLIFHVGTLL